MDCHGNPTTSATSGERRHGRRRSKTGRPWKLDHLRHEFKRVLTKIGHPQYSRHGLRKNAVNNLLEAGCSDKQVSAVTGMSQQMVDHYSRRVDQKRLAEQAIRKLIKNERRIWGG